MKYAILAVAFVILAGSFHIMFTMYDYLYYNDTTGVFHVIPEILNETMLPEYQNSSWNASQVLYEAFGIGRFVWFGVAMCCIAVEAIKHPRMEE